MLFEGGRVGEELFATDETAKADLDVSGRSAVERSEEIRLNGEFVAIESGAGAGVSDGGPEAAGGGFDGFGDVDTARDDLAFGRLEIESGNGLL